MKNKKTKRITFLAMFIAIEVILVVTPLGFIPIGPLSITTMHIPVIIAGIILGEKEGAKLGFVFGLASFIQATLRPSITSFCFSPFVTIGNLSGNWSSLVIAFVPRILLGYFAGLSFKLLSSHFSNSKINAMIAGLVGSLTNTILVLSGIYIFFGQMYAQAIGVAYSTLITVLFGVVISNGLIEALLAAIISAFLYLALKNYVY